MTRGTEQHSSFSNPTERWVREAEVLSALGFRTPATAVAEHRAANRRTENQKEQRSSIKG